MRTENPKDHCLSLRCTEEEKERIKQDAFASGFPTVSLFLRHIALEHASVPKWERAILEQLKAMENIQIDLVSVQLQGEDLTVERLEDIREQAHQNASAEVDGMLLNIREAEQAQAGWTDDDEEEEGEE